MDATPGEKKYKKQNWKYLDVTERDIRLMKMIVEQKFLTRPHVIENVFDGARSYAKVRIRKLKKFGYLNAVKTLADEPESYLLGKAGIEALREAGCVVGVRGFSAPDAQNSIEIAFYDHDKKVTDVRFLFERLGMCKDWKSEKVLRAGTKGERKVPDGVFTRNGIGIAIEVELHVKKAHTYRKIFEVYERDPKIRYIFYVCGDASIREKVMKEAGERWADRMCFVLYKELMEFREQAVLRTWRGSFALKEVL